MARVYISQAALVLMICATMTLQISIARAVTRERKKGCML